MQTPRPIVVLDTNVVLDWLWFADRSCDTLGQHIVAGGLRWIGTPWMRDELGHVLQGGTLSTRAVQPVDVLRTWDRHAEMIDASPSSGAALRLRCTDPDDQAFIDLALSQRAAWLVSRDRAVLKLARRAREHGLDILGPGTVLDDRLVAWHTKNPGIDLTDGQT